MCWEVEYNGTKAESIGELVAMLGAENIYTDKAYAGSTIDCWRTDDMCLCPIDIEKTAAELGLNCEQDIITYKLSKKELI